MSIPDTELIELGQPEAYNVNTELQTRSSSVGCRTATIILACPHPDVICFGLWTLFGTYVRGRCGPNGTGPKFKISSLGGAGTLRNAPNQLEVDVRVVGSKQLIRGRGGIGRRACLRCMYPQRVKTEGLPSRGECLKRREETASPCVRPASLCALQLASPCGRHASSAEIQTGALPPGPPLPPACVEERENRYRG